MSPPVQSMHEVFVLRNGNLNSGIAMIVANGARPETWVEPTS